MEPNEYVMNRHPRHDSLNKTQIRLPISQNKQNIGCCSFNCPEATMYIHHLLTLAMNRGPATSIVVLSNLITTCRDGPAVSLKESPTVSPVIDALRGMLWFARTPTYVS